MQYQPLYQMSFSHPQPQPRPRFCIFRPGGLLAPLIPIDELPSWLQICNWSPDMYMGLQPVSPSFIPREGEYDVICHHCSSSVDSLHQSVSERNTDSQSPHSSPKSAASQSKSCPGGFFGALPDCDAPPMVSRMPFGAAIPLPGHPPFQSALQNPFLGMYMLQMPCATANIMPTVMPTPAALEKALDIASTCSQMGSALSKGSNMMPENCYPLNPHSSGSDADSERSAKSHSRTPVRSKARRLDSPDPRSKPPSSPNSRIGFDPTMEEPSLCSTTVLHETASLLNESIASTVSLTAAVERLKERLGTKLLARGPTAHSIQRNAVNVVPQSRSSSKIHKVRTSAQRRNVRIRHRRRAKKPPQSASKTSNANNEPLAEQPNSATKRRDRREKLLRGKKGSNASIRCIHNDMLQNGRFHAPHR
ncbi:hypothetical protein N7462_001946 [Penicillium macrosclerotiorum]|uniref:uncharacterized protein n=1 Tax=Penicillium macrosclerotiorum TaxID=303699 RepID=UPI0025471601|nr:uncharacterized protein N7462_001946 [Penicillium macrosclerotiorum]KAJ5692523.1 hypothetical protein N7462_001946 [Penicillium macrosclerotiorum]